MKDHIKSFQLSLILHLVAIAVLLTVSTRFIQTEPVLVIDLSDMNFHNLSEKGNSRSNQNPLKAAKTHLKSIVQETAASPLASALPVKSQMQPEEIERMKETLQEPYLSSFPAVREPSRAPESRSEDNEFSSLQNVRPDPNLGNIAGAVSYGNENTGKALYLKKHFLYIRDIIQRNIVYPTLARKMGWQGKVIISFLIMPNGNSIDVKIVKTSGQDILDRNAVETVKRSSPFPAPPVKAEITVPVVYALQ